MKTILAILLVMLALNTRAVPTIDYQFEYFDSTYGWIWVTYYTFTAGTIGKAEYSIDGITWKELENFGRIGNDGGGRTTFSPGPSSGFPMYLIRAVELP